MDRDNKTNFLLKRDWLRFAESAKKSAAGWLKGQVGWSKDECINESTAYMKTYEQMLERAKAAPVRIVIYYVDGRTEVIE